MIHILLVLRYYFFMKKVFTTVVLFTSIIILLLILYFYIFSPFSLRTKNIGNHESYAFHLRNILQNQLELKNNVADNDFFLFCDSLFSDPQLKILAVFSKDDKLLYIQSTSPEYFYLSGNKENSSPIPQYDYNFIREYLYSEAAVVGDNLYHFEFVLEILDNDEYNGIFRRIAVTLGMSLVILCLLLLLQKILSAPSPSEKETDEDKEPPVTKNETEVIEKKNKEEEKSRNLFNPESNLGWFDYLETRLTFELKRSASFDQDLVLIIFHIHPLDDQHKYNAIAQKILEFSNFQDLAFEYDQRQYAVILPGLELDQAIRKVEFFQKKILESFSSMGIQMNAGLSSRNGRLLSGKTLMGETEKAVEKSLSEGKNKIIAFRSDPQQYRSFIARSL